MSSVSVSWVTAFTEIVENHESGTWKASNALSNGRFLSVESPPPLPRKTINYRLIGIVCIMEYLVQPPRAILALSMTNVLRMDILKKVLALPSSVNAGMDGAG